MAASSCHPSVRHQHHHHHQLDFWCGLNNKIIARSTMKQEENQKMKSGYDTWKRNALRRCLNIASDGADDGRLFQELAPETAWKSPFSDGGKVEWRDSKLIGAWRKPTGVSAGMARQWHGWSMTTDTLVHCRSKLWHFHDNFLSETPPRVGTTWPLGSDPLENFLYTMESLLHVK